MKWSYILFLPALTSVAWALATVLFRRRLTHAQVVLSLMLVLVAFASSVLAVFFRGKEGGLFIYDYMFEVVAMVCGPMYYIGICALTEPRSVSLKQRRVFFIPLLFIVGMTIGVWILGARRYELMCHALREGTAIWIAGDTAWNFVLFWEHWLFPLLMIVVNFVLVLVSNRKVNLYQQRFNSFYAQDMQVPYIDSRQLNVLTWLFIPLSVAVFILVEMRPHYYKYWLIGCSVLLTLLQFIVGRFTYRLNYDARHLAEYIRNKTDVK